MPLLTKIVLMLSFRGKLEPEKYFTSIIENYSLRNRLQKLFESDSLKKNGKKMNCMSYIELWHAHVASLRGLCLKLQSRVSSCLTENDIGLRLLQYNKAIKIHPHTNIKPVMKTNKTWKTLEKNHSYVNV